MIFKQVGRFAILLMLPTAFAVRAEPGPAGAACGPSALGTGRTLQVGTQNGLEIGLKTYAQTLPLGDGEVALTFDDGPNARTTPAILDALKAECVRATFFLIGRHAAELPALVRREVADGHTIGHHTFSHPAATLRRMTTAAAEADIDAGFKADDLAAYGNAAAEPRVPFFRFPGFADTPEVDRWLAGRSIGVFGADLWASDWVQMTPQAELALLMSRLNKTHGGIVLLHDTKASTAAMLPALLRALKAKGFRIVHLVPGSGRGETKAAPPGWSSETDRIIRGVFRQEDARAHQASGASQVAVGRAARRPDSIPQDRATP